MKFCKRIVALAVVCFIMLLPVLPTVVYASANSAISNEAQEHILSQIRRARIPNAAIAVIQDGETSFILQDTTYDALYNIASVSKSFTGFAVLLLEDMGLLSVSDPVNRHLPWFGVYYNGVPVPHEDITIYNLLHHTSGISSNENRFPRAAVTETTNEFISRLMGMELDFYPSTQFVYGNMNFVLLGLLIEAVSGQSYDEFMTQHVLHPLGLYNTFTNIQRAHATGRVIGGNDRAFFMSRSRDWSRYNHYTIVPTGGIYSGIADIARWAGIHLGVVEVSEQFARIVQRSHMHHHETDAPFVNSTMRSIFTGMDFYAAGWVVDTDTGKIEHGGQNPGYSSIVTMFPERGTAVVVLSNLRYGSIDRLGRVALDAAVDGSFNRVGFELFEIVDAVSTIFIVVGIVYLALFIRLAIRVNKRLRSGEKIRADFSLKNIIKFPIISIAGLIFYYNFQWIIMDTTRASIMQNWPISFAVAAIAIWIMTLYDLFSWLAKAFIQKDAV